MSKRNPFASEEPITLASESNQLTASDLHYDYNQLPEKSRMHIQSAAAQIKLNLKRAQNSILEVGKHLTYAKQLLAHGQWGEWLAAEFDLTDRSAQRYMQAWGTYGNRPESAALLTSSALMLLSSDTVPEPAREEVEQKSKEEGKSPTKREVQAIIEKHAPRTLTLQETAATLRKAIASYSKAYSRTWLTERDTPAKASYLLTANKSFDPVLYESVRSELLRELQTTWASEPQAAQKPAERTFASHAPNTRTVPAAPEIAHATPATQSDSLLLDGLVMQYEDAFKLLPKAKQLIEDPAFQWTYDRLIKDLPVIINQLKKLQ